MSEQYTSFRKANPDLSLPRLKKINDPKFDTWVKRLVHLKVYKEWAKRKSERPESFWLVAKRSNLPEYRKLMAVKKRLQDHIRKHIPEEYKKKE